MTGFARVLGMVGLKLPVFGVNRAGAVPDPGNDLSNAKVLTQTGWTVGGSGDVVGPSASVTGEVALFDGTTGKLIKRAAITGLAKLASGVLSAATQGTDYYAPSGTDVAVADGGTGSSTAAGACTNLGAIPASTLTTADDLLTRDGSGPIRLAAGGRGKGLMVDPLSGSLAYVPVASLPIRVVTPDGTTIRAILGSPSLIGSGQSDTSDTAGQWLQFGGSTSGQNYGWSMQVGKGVTPFCADFIIRTTGGTGGRMWFGVAAGAPSNSDTPANNSAWICFRNGTDTQWTAITRDGSSTSSAQNIAAIATTTSYRLRIRYDGTNYYMRVNNSGEVTCSANLPSTSSTLSFFAVVTSDGSARTYEFCWSAYRPTQPSV